MVPFISFADHMWVSCLKQRSLQKATSSQSRTWAISPVLCFLPFGQTFVYGDLLLWHLRCSTNLWWDHFLASEASCRFLRPAVAPSESLHQNLFHFSLEPVWGFSTCNFPWQGGQQVLLHEEWALFCLLWAWFPVAWPDAPCPSIGREMKNRALHILSGLSWFCWLLSYVHYSNHFSLLMSPVFQFSSHRSHSRPLVTLFSFSGVLPALVYVWDENIKTARRNQNMAKPWINTVVRLHLLVIR